MNIRIVAFTLACVLAGQIAGSGKENGGYKMNTKETIEGYFRSLRERGDWQSFLSENIVFTSYTYPVKQLAGKNAFAEGTKRFYSMIVSFEVRDLLVDDHHACALTRYELQPPGGNPFISDVAEVFTVSNGKIDSFAIYFDSSPFPK